MVGGILEVLESMESGVYNFCKNGKCSGCGECCSALLPMSDDEVLAIQKYVEDKGIKVHRHLAGSPFTKLPIDMTCPFLDNTKADHKCDVYEVRPKICRTFICSLPPSKVKENRDLFWKDRKAVYLWDVFG